MGLILRCHGGARVRTCLFSIPRLLGLLGRSRGLAGQPLYLSAGGRVARILSSLVPLEGHLTSFHLDVHLRDSLTFVICLFARLFGVFFLARTVSTSHTFFLLRNGRRGLRRMFHFFKLVSILYSISRFQDGLPCCSLPRSYPRRVSFRMRSVCRPLVRGYIPGAVALCNGSTLVANSGVSKGADFVHSVKIGLLSTKTLRAYFTRRFYSSPSLGLTSTVRVRSDLVRKGDFFLRRMRAIGRVVSLDQRKGRLFLLSRLFGKAGAVRQVTVTGTILSTLIIREGLIFVSARSVRLTSLLGTRCSLCRFYRDMRSKMLSFSCGLGSNPIARHGTVHVLSVYNCPRRMVRRTCKMMNQVYKFWFYFQVYKGIVIALI